MDDAFLKELDESLSNVGVDVHWERVIGGRKVWLSPIPFTGQKKCLSVISDPALGDYAIIETKRVTLAYSIVGFEKKDGGGVVIDLRPFRNGELVFPVYDERVGKVVKVDLPTYIQKKTQDWGFQWVSDAFDVWADLMESHKRENLEEIQFENAKNPLVELAELEEKARVLREQLGKPPLVEASPKDDETDSEAEAAPETEEFNPFKAVKAQEAAGRRPLPDLRPPTVTVPVPMPPSSLQPGGPREAAVAARAAEIAAMDSLPFPSRVASPSPPVAPSQAAIDDVIESRPASKLVEPPVFDRIPQNINPRFAPQGR